MRFLLTYMTPEECRIVLRGCTKREVDSLVWCLEQMAEHERRPYLQQFIDISASAKPFLDGVRVREMVKA